MLRKKRLEDQEDDPKSDSCPNALSYTVELLLTELKTRLSIIWCYSVVARLLSEVLGDQERAHAEKLIDSCGKRPYSGELNYSVPF